MAPPRAHLSEVSSLFSAGDASVPSVLAAVGAGACEAWLDNLTLLASLAPGGRRHIAIANASRSVLVVLPLLPGPSAAIVRPAIVDGRISAIEWVPVGDGDDARAAIAVGTTDGFLMFYSAKGELLHKQSIYPSKILKLRFREGKRDLLQDSGSSELCIVFSGVIARFDGLDLQTKLQNSYQDVETHHGWQNKLHKDDLDDADSFGKIPFQLWSVSKNGSCADAAIVGLMPPPLLESQSSQRHYCVVTVGEDAVVSAYRVSEDRSRSMVGAILSRVVPATFSTIASVSKLIWRSDTDSQKKSRPKPQSFAKASALTCLKDPPRKGEKLTLSPSGSLAAITDSLGRILLLDTQALVAVRLWKGYRDASCHFVEMIVNKDRRSTSGTGYSKSDYCLCLAIHAPRKGIIEIWQMRTGPRLLTIQCLKGSRMLQPSTRYSSSTSSSYAPLEIFLFNGDSGQLCVLNKQIG